MVSLTFHGGVNEIGGNKILLEYGDTRIWLDFGKSFTMGEDSRARVSQECGRWDSHTDLLVRARGRVHGKLHGQYSA